MVHVFQFLMWKQESASEHLPSMRDECQMADSPNGFQTLQDFYKRNQDRWISVTKTKDPKSIEFKL